MLNRLLRASAAALINGSAFSLVPGSCVRAVVISSTKRPSLIFVAAADDSVPLWSQFPLKLLPRASIASERKLANSGGIASASPHKPSTNTARSECAGQRKWSFQPISCLTRATKAGIFDSGTLRVPYLRAGLAEEDVVKAFRCEKREICYSGLLERLFPQTPWIIFAALNLRRNVRTRVEAVERCRAGPQWSVHLGPTAVMREQIGEPLTICAYTSSWSAARPCDKVSQKSCSRLTPPLSICKCHYTPIFFSLSFLFLPYINALSLFGRLFPSGPWYFQICCAHAQFSGSSQFFRSN